MPAANWVVLASPNQMVDWMRPRTAPVPFWVMEFSSVDHPAYHLLLDRCQQALESSSRAVCIAIDGHSAAGKSTLAHCLADVFGAALVVGDDFYAVMDEEARARLSPLEGVELYYDWMRMRNEALVPLLDGRQAVYRPYAWESNHLSTRTVTLEPTPLVVVEGLFVARPELTDLISLAVLVEANPEVRAVRQQYRDDDEAWVQRWDEAERYYFSNVRPPNSFDVRITWC